MIDLLIKLSQISFRFSNSTNFVGRMLGQVALRSNMSRRFSTKVFESAKKAVADIKDNSTLLVGGFGLCGIPESLIAAVKDKGVTVSI